MRYLLIVVGLCTFFATSAISQDSTIEDVISRQIEAFKADDFATAFSFASPTIQMTFGSPENFGSMVRGQYPMIWRPADVELLNRIENDGVTWQRIKFVDQNGAAHWFAYEMIEISGAWRINGVYLLEQPTPTV